MSQNIMKSLILLSLLISLSMEVEILSTNFNLLGSSEQNVAATDYNLLTMATPLVMFQPAHGDQNLLSMAMPTMTINSVVSLCQAHEVQSSQNVCIKPQYIEGCQVYETVSTCNKCDNGYILNKNKVCDFQATFTGIVSHIKGCLKQSNAQCEICAEGFYMTEHKCVLGIKHCAVYNNDGECTECEQDYSLILSQCRRNSLLGCKYETSSHTCQECYPPFTLNGQHCDIDQCRILNDYGCVSCECGFYLTPERDCKPIASGCLRYEKGICRDCLPHYKLKGGVCEIQGCNQYSGSYCKKCSQKYELIDGECLFKNCNDWLNDQCISCKQGFGLSNGICIKADPVKCQ